MKLRVIFFAALLSACSDSTTEPLSTSVTPEGKEVAEREQLTSPSVGAHLYNAGSESLVELRDGWSVAEGWGTWTEGPTANLDLFPKLNGANTLHVYFHVFPPPENPDYSQSFRVRAADEVIGDWTFTAEEGSACLHRVITLSEPLDGDTLISLTFDIASPTSPKDLGLPDSDRKIGMGLIQIIERSNSDPTPQKPC